MSITFKENSITEKEETFLHELLRSTQWGDLNLGNSGLIKGKVVGNKETWT